VLSGYFRPMDNRVQVKNAIKRVDPFHRNAALRRANSPAEFVHLLPAGSKIPQFWVAAARAVRGDMLAAMNFVAALKALNPATPLIITPNGAHNAVAWRSMIVSMLEWMTPRLTHAAAALGCQGCAPPATVAAPSPRPRINRPLSLPNQDQAPGRAQRPAGAGRLAALGAGRLPDKVRRATG
jgi:hypothetical protein